MTAISKPEMGIRDESYEKMVQSLAHPYKFGQRVQIDGDLIAVVTAVCYKATALLIEVSYFHNGEQKCVFVEDFRVRPYERD